MKWLFELQSPDFLGRITFGIKLKLLLGKSHAVQRWRLLGQQTPKFCFVLLLHGGPFLYMRALVSVELSGQRTSPPTPTTPSGFAVRPKQLDNLRFAAKYRGLGFRGVSVLILACVLEEALRPLETQCPLTEQE